MIPSLIQPQSPCAFPHGATINLSQSPGSPSCGNMTQSSIAGGARASRVFTLPGRWADLETEGEINTMGGYQMYCPKLYTWCSPLIPQTLMKTKQDFSPSHLSLFQHLALAESFICMCGPRSALGPPESWHDGQSYISRNDDRISLGKYDCFGLDCQGWLSAPALRCR